MERVWKEALALHILRRHIARLPAIVLHQWSAVTARLLKWRAVLQAQRNSLMAHACHPL
jgi:hypothetical protein